MVRIVIYLKISELSHRALILNKRKSEKNMGANLWFLKMFSSRVYLGISERRNKQTHTDLPNLLANLAPGFPCTI